MLSLNNVADLVINSSAIGLVVATIAAVITQVRLKLTSFEDYVCTFLVGFVSYVFAFITALLCFVVVEFFPDLVSKYPLFVMAVGLVVVYVIGNLAFHVISWIRQRRDPFKIKKRNWDDL